MVSVLSGEQRHSHGYFKEMCGQLVLFVFNSSCNIDVVPSFFVIIRRFYVVIYKHKFDSEMLDLLIVVTHSFRVRSDASVISSANFYCTRACLNYFQTQMIIVIIKYLSDLIIIIKNILLQ
jgi:hypothetical protein